MEDRIKQRLIGILVIVGALFIILPFLFHNSRPSLPQITATDNTNAAAVSVTLPENNTSSSAASISQNNSVATKNTSPASSVAANVTQQSDQSQNNASNATNLQNSASTNPGVIALHASDSASHVSLATSAANQPIASPPSKSLPSTASAVVHSAVSEPVIAASGLTKGESDDQPSTMQKAKADMLPPAPMPLNAGSVKTTAIAPSVQHEIATKRRITHEASHTPKHQYTETHHAVTGDYTVQVGAFSEKVNAQRLVENLHHHHFNAFAQTVFHDHRRLYIVFVGPEKGLHQAKLTQLSVKRELHLNSEIRKHA